MAERNPSILTRVIGAAAERLAQHPSIPPENRVAFRQAAESVMHGTWASMFGGETVWVRIYAARITAEDRARREARILEALALGDAPEAVARRERVTVRWVQKLRKRTACINSSPAGRDDQGSATT